MATLTAEAAEREPLMKATGVDGVPIVLPLVRDVVLLLLLLLLIIMMIIIPI